MRKGTGHSAETKAKMRKSHSKKPSQKGLTFEELYGPEKAAEMKANMSAAKKGKTAEEIWGNEEAERKREKQRSVETRAKKSKSLKGRTYVEMYGEEGAKERIAKQKAALTGRKISAEHKAKVSAANKGRKFTKEHKQKLREKKLRENHWRWKGEDFVREYPREWGEVRMKALERDKFKCVKCGITANDHRRTHKRGLHVDHINADKYDLRLENLQTLCPSCHVDKTFGRS